MDTPIAISLVSIGHLMGLTLYANKEALSDPQILIDHIMTVHKQNIKKYEE